MKSAFESDLVEALDDLEAGLPLEEILSRYPEQAEQLRPILETGAQLSTLPVAHSLSAQAASRDAFLKQATALRHQEQHSVVAPVSLWRRFALSLASLTVVVMLLGGVVAGAAQEALPGQALYPVKRTLEEVRLSLVSDRAEQEALQAQFRAERQEEINALLAAGLEGTVECEGKLQAIAADSWTIDGLEIAIRSTTTINGSPQIGLTVRGTCQVTEGQVVGKTLRVETERHPAPSPSATPTVPSTATPTATTTPTATAPSATLDGNTLIQPEETEESEPEEGDNDNGGDEEVDPEDDDAGDDDDEPESGDDEPESGDNEAESEEEEESDDEGEESNDEEDTESESEPDDDPDGD